MIRINQPILIGIYLKRSHLLVVSILSAIFRNLCFVPLDPIFPVERLKYIINTSKIEYILTEQDMVTACSLINNLQLPLNLILINQSEIENYSNVKLIVSSSNCRKNSPQYILYTSGSTGNPKGVMISQDNLHNFILAMQHLKLCNTDDYLLAITGLHFDISLLELLLPIAVGAAVEVASIEIVADGKKLADRINDQPVTMIQATPSTYRMMQNAGWKATKSLKLLTGGENIDKSLIAFLLEQKHIIHNMYGPTETTIWSTSAQLNDCLEISLGMPIANTSLYILDSNNNPVPNGIAGELGIGGKGVGLGYINTPNNNNFITLKTGKKIYKTGDIVRYYGNNYLKFIGRSDSQVKLRGFRVELSEITKIIKQFVDCYEAITVLRTLPEPHLISFIQPSSKDINIAYIQNILPMHLPNYMLPQRIIAIRSFPLTFNFKIDNKKLQDDNLDELIRNYGYDEIKEHTISDSPLIDSQISDNHARDKLLTLLSEQFKITIKADHYNFPLGFFGFNSISFNRLASLIRENFKVAINPHHFYNYNTINKLSAYLEKHNKAYLDFDHSDYRNKITNSSAHNKIAIVGIGGKLPQATNLDYFWINLMNAQNAITKNNRLTLSENFRAGFLDNIDQFDASFFNISPLEAIAMDPQQRLILEASWHTLEDAGYSPQALEGSNVGVYVAVTGQDYYSIQNQYNTFSPIPYSLPGIAHSILANRLSHFFNWHGPSLTIDTACSGSLVSLVRAYHDLTYGLVDFALIVSSNIILDQNINEALKVGNFLSASYRCATFDEAADGYVRGEGVGCVFY